MVAASRDSNADDEHDPEGATIAFERAQLRAILSQGVADLAAAPVLAPAPATAVEIRAWAALNGYVVSDRGRVPRKVAEAFAQAQR